MGYENYCLHFYLESSCNFEREQVFKYWYFFTYVEAFEFKTNHYVLSLNLSLYLFYPSFPPVSPPLLAVPPGGQVVSVREGGSAELVCLVVSGKPRPPILWSRIEKDLLMPSGQPTVETPDGRLRLNNVSRDMMGAYRCQTAPYNGLNIKRRETQVQLNVQCKYGSSCTKSPTRQCITTTYRSSSIDSGMWIVSSCTTSCSDSQCPWLFFIAMLLYFLL